MPRVFWKGAISFGMVIIPVRMYVATKTDRPSFHMLHNTCHSKVKQVLYCPRDDQYLDRDDTIKGYEYAKGQFVILSEADFEKVPIKTKHIIDVLGFADSKQVDPLYYYDAHYLEPEEIGERPYALFRQALAETDRVAIAKTAFQRKEHLCSVRPDGNILVLHSLHYANELRSPEEIKPPETQARPEELKMAKSLINEMAIDFKLSDYKDNYAAALKQLIQAKLEGREVVQPSPPPMEVVPELMVALRQSIEARRKEKERAPAAAGRR